MKIGDKYTAGDIARFLGCPLVGDDHCAVTGINAIERCEAGDLVLADDARLFESALRSGAIAILTTEELAAQTDIDAGKAKILILSSSPFEDYNKLTRRFVPHRPQLTMTGENCEIADSAHLSPNCFIGNEVHIGENVIIHPGAYIGDGTVLEDNVVIGPNSVIGHYGFFYRKQEKGHTRMHSCGYVHLAKDVEVGALCSIDAGITAVTYVGEGTKIDNQVQIGHDTVIGKHCLFAAKVGIASYVNIQDHVTMWGQVGCTSGVTIGEGAVILAQSGIGKDLEGGKTWFGSPCSEVAQKFREMAALRKLPEILEKL